MEAITLKQLRYFHALAKTRHFSRAADLCAISQPALSMQIKDLEARLPLPLLETASKPLQLTPYGDAFAKHAGMILQHVQELGDLANASHMAPQGLLRLGVIPTIAPYLFPRLIQSMTEAFPRLELKLRETITSNLITDILEGRLDAAILALPVSEPRLSEVPLFEEEFVLVRPLSESGKPVPHPESLHEMRLLLLEEGHCFRDQALTVCNISSSQTRDLMDASSLSTLVQMVGSGLGVTLIPNMAVPLESRSVKVEMLRFTASPPKRTVGMIWRRNTPLEAHLKKIADVVAAPDKFLA